MPSLKQGDGESDPNCARDTLGPKVGSNFKNILRLTVSQMLNAKVSLLVTVGVLHDFISLRFTVPLIRVNYAVFAPLRVAFLPLFVILSNR